MKNLFLSFLVLTFAVALPNSSCSPKFGGLMDVLGSQANLKEMFDLIEAAGGIKKVMGGLKEFTMFAPTNEAFSKVPAELQQALTDPTKQSAMRNLLQLHTAEGKLSASDLANATGDVMGAAGNVFDIAGGANNLTINGANVLETIDVGNGLIHVIDKVL